MMKTLLLCALLVTWGSRSLQAKTGPINTAGLSSGEAVRLFEKGISLNEDLIRFFADRPCELGKIKGCQKALLPRDIETVKSLLRDLERWRLEANGRVQQSLWPLKGLPTILHYGESLKFEVTSSVRLGLPPVKRTMQLTYNPEDAASRGFIQEVRFGAALNLLVYDSFFRLSELMSGSSKLQGILQYDIPREGKLLQKTYGQALSAQRWKATRNALRLLQWEKSKRSPQATLTSTEKLFEDFLEKSFTARKLEGSLVNLRLKAFSRIKKQVISAHFWETLNWHSNHLSRLFGLSAGRFKVRSGKLKKVAGSPQSLRLLQGRLRPLDILMDKKPFRLTDKFIPGYYGHVAVWLGSYEELAAQKVEFEGRMISLLDHPDVAPHKARLAAGRTLVEALPRPGVTLSSFAQYLDVDDMLVLRGEAMENDRRGEHLLRAIRQVGKPYDFNFDVETQRALVCSELVYTVFEGETWPLDKTMGRFTIKPDQVAIKAADSCFSPAILFHDGREVLGHKTQKLLELLKAPPEISKPAHCPEIP